MFHRIRNRFKCSLLIKLSPFISFPYSLSFLTRFNFCALLSGSKKNLYNFKFRICTQKTDKYNIVSIIYFPIYNILSLRSLNWNSICTYTYDTVRSTFGNFNHLIFTNKINIWNKYIRSSINNAVSYSMSCLQKLKIIWKIMLKVIWRIEWNRYNRYKYDYF